MNVLLLFGGIGEEYEISLRSAAAVLTALPQSHTVFKVGIRRTGEWYLTEATPSAIAADRWLEGARPVLLSPCAHALMVDGDFKTIIYGVLLTIMPITVGVFLYKMFFNDSLSATTIAGGMTSTPAIGVLVEKYNNISLSKYALAYFGALITIVILIRINVMDIL